jgi:hypothetical protein
MVLFSQLCQLDYIQMKLIKPIAIVFELGLDNPL